MLVMKISKAQRQRVTAVIVILLILFCDQLIKYLVKTNMTLHESIPMAGNWAILYFTENKGMAFGVDFMGTFFLSMLRIVAVGALIYYLNKAIKNNVPTGFIVCLSMVLAGAAGNIFDNMFYGLIFSESSPYSVASLVPFGDGYGNLFGGRVVDMFYFPLIETTWPDWVPLWGGDRFVFFSPIFNFADSAITCGGFATVILYHKTFSKYFSKERTKTGGEGE